ncbi:hypothetical protein D3C79_953090 [compost metagenome]
MNNCATTLLIRLVKVDGYLVRPSQQNQNLPLSLSFLWAQCVKPSLYWWMRGGWINNKAVAPLSDG